MNTLFRIVALSACAAGILSLPACKDTSQPAATIQRTGNPKQKPAVAAQQPAIDATVTAAADSKPAAPAVQPVAQQPATPVQGAAETDLSHTLVDNLPAALSADAAGHDAHGADAGHSHQPADPAAYAVVAEPMELDFGDVPTMDSKVANLKLTNTSHETRTIVTSRPSCGCTTLKLANNTPLGPGESVDIEVRLTGGPKAGPIHGKTVTFIVEDQPELVVRLSGNSVAYVVMEPEELVPEENPEGKFKLRSIDGEAFRIISMEPQVIEGFSQDAKAEHDLSISWDKYRAIGVSRKTVFHLDHPKCAQLYANIRFSQQELNAADARRRDELMKNRPLPVAGAGPQADLLLTSLIRDRKNDEVMQRLQQGMDVNYRDASGASLVALAARYGNVDLLRRLLEAKADFNATDNVERTPLMWAAQSKNVEGVRALLSAGASVPARDKTGGSALSWACMQGDAASVRELVDAGADVEVTTELVGWTPLIWAAGFGDPGSIDPLADAHANLEAEDYIQGATPLIHAARTGKVEALRALLRHGAKLEHADRNGHTALLAAAANAGGTAEKVQILLEAGANVHAQDNRKLTALDLARKRVDTRAADVIKLLEEYVAKHPAQ